MLAPTRSTQRGPALRTRSLGPSLLNFRHPLHILRVGQLLLVLASHVDHEGEIVLESIPTVITYCWLGPVRALELISCELLSR